MQGKHEAVQGEHEAVQGKTRGWACWLAVRTTTGMEMSGYDRIALVAGTLPA